LLSLDLFDYAILGLIIFHVILNPYTKVEETFITNNIYDHLVYGLDIASYDFHEFPGVVERSFIPSIIVSVLSLPFHHLFLDLYGYSCIISLYVTRIVLGLLVFFSTKYVKSTISRVLKSQAIAESFSMLYIVQFHTLFYSSRPLPNIFALVITNIAYAYWMQRKWGCTISLLAIASIIFR